MTIAFDDFEKVEMRIGRIVEIDDLAEARKPAYRLLIDFGEYGRKNSSAQITKNYTKAELLNRQIVAVTNFAPKRIAGFKSEVLVLGALDENNEVIILTPDSDLPSGNRVF